MENTATKSNRKLLTVLAIVVVLVVVAAVAVYALLGSSGSKSKTASTASTGQPFPRVATKDQVKQNLTDLNDSLKQATTDQAAAKTALQESQTQVKVGN